MPYCAKLRGFTLVELMVVIVILAILSVVGVVVFKGVSDSARDSRRKADVTAIAKAYETNYQGAYVPVTDSNFASGSIPTPPEGGDYYSVTDGAGFKVCAKLNNYPGSDQYCNMTSDNCFCKGSAQGRIQSGSGLTGFGSEMGTGGDNNMLSNPSFEGGSASGWSFYRYPVSGPSGTGSVTTEKSYLGSYSYKIDDTGGTGEVAISYSGLTFVTGYNYRISAWVYSTTTRGAIQGHFGGGWSGGDGFEVHVPSNKTNQWYPVSITRTAGGVTPTLRCGAFYGSVAPGTVYCDGVVVERVP